ncbi:MAG: hypothetical protein EBU90_06715 [Proteobacteria bacterium]|nr:hypothetical protein [Pseudomonadota bacterium]NBP15000.1 hypothetical protein [bacterium]
MVIPQDYFIQKFYQYAGLPKYNRATRTHQGCCPICREGSSWGKKKRSYYILEDNVICCHNCGWYSSPCKWIETVSGMTYQEIIKESSTYDILPLDLLKEEEPINRKPVEISKLPKDSINLFDPNQIEYYKDNSVVKDALSVIRKRKLHVAVNRPDSLWVSLSDKTHKNRLIIPFYNEQNNIIFYQSRAIYDSDTRLRPKYLSKINSEKSIFGINKITPNLDNIFIFEGPIDSFFIRNGVAVAGIQENSSNTFTALQQAQLLNFKLLNKIWVLDSQWLDTASRIKTDKLIKQGETVFVWPEDKGKSFKDMNEYCVANNISSIDPEFIVSNSYAGLKAELIMVSINRYRKK